MKKSISIRDEFIKLGQAMKLAGLVDSGVDAKYAIEEGSVKVNGETDLRRGRKLYNGVTPTKIWKNIILRYPYKNDHKIARIK